MAKFNSLLTKTLTWVALPWDTVVLQLCSAETFPLNYCSMSLSMLMMIFFEALLFGYTLKRISSSMQ